MPGTCSANCLASSSWRSAQGHLRACLQSGGQAVGVQMPAKVVVDDSDAVVELVAKGNGGMLAAVRSVLTGHESQAVITADHRRAPGRENHPPDVGYADGVFGIVPKRSAVAAKARLGTVRYASQIPRSTDPGPLRRYPRTSCMY